MLHNRDLIYSSHKRATHPPYPPPKRQSADSSSSSSKKPLIKIDPLRTWLKEAFTSLIASPLLVPSAITKAIKAPPGNSGRSLWAKMLASFRSVLLRKGEEGEGDGSSGDEDRADQLKENVASLYKRWQERMVSPLMQLIQSSRVAKKKEPSKSHRSVRR